ncbi:MAG: DNA polymerase III subunit delta [Firmicutes bacterium ADurb.Bin080]|jgi:DNA polymerase-3 subunit delta|nr:MAG: DNA polymerase III subunit delta [Firmicutes bacterium ADurb.Bin080]
MKAEEFDLKKFNKGAFILEGTDTYWRDKVIKEFCSLVPEEYKSFNLKQLDKIDSPSSLRDSLITFSMFPSPSVVLSYDEKFEDKGDASFSKIIQEIDEDTYFLIIYYGKISASLMKVFTVIECVRSSPQVINRVVKKALGETQIDQAAFDLLIRYCNSDLSRILMEIDKLISYVDGKKISLNDVEINVANDIEDAIFELSDALSSKKNHRAKELVDRFLERGYNYSALLALLTNHYRRIFHSALSPLSDLDLSKVLGVKEYAIKKSRMIASKYTKVRLKEIMDMLVDTDFSFKSGKMTDETAFKTLFSKLIAF